MNSAPEISPEAIYTGNSMRGMFVPGERLFLEPVLFDSLRVGDIVAIFDRTPFYVHRVVELDPARAVTMGDNNLRPDAAFLTPGSHFKRVIRAQGLDGSLRTIPGGELGMAQFRRQQRRRRLLASFNAAFRPFKVVKYLRIPARTVTRFRNGTVQWSCAGIPVAAQSPSGTFQYLHWSRRFFFRVPAGCLLNAPDSGAPRTDGDQTE